MKTILLILFWSLLTTAWAKAPLASDALLSQADQLFSNGQLEQAENRYQAAIAATPNNLEAYMRLGGFYLSQHKIAAAIVQFQTALGIDPQFARAFAALGIAYWHHGDYALAEAALQQALQLEPELPEAKKLLNVLEKKLQTLEAPSPHGKIPEHQADSD